jgi:hypothetical protein
VKRTLVVALVAVSVVVGLPGQAPASTGVLTTKPETVRFGTKPVGSYTLKSATVTNTASQTVNLLVTVVREWDDFQFGLLPGETCPVLEPQPLAPGERCDVVVAFRPTEFFAGVKQDEVLLATATDPVTGEVLDSVQIVFLGKGR